MSPGWVPARRVPGWGARPGGWGTVPGMGVSGVGVVQWDASMVGRAAAVAATAIVETGSGLPAGELERVLERWASTRAWEAVFAERTVFGVFDGGRLVGVAAVHEVMGGVGYLSMCNVVERRRGFGARLVAARLAFAREQGWVSVLAHVDAGNVASLANLRRFEFNVVERDGSLLTLARHL